MDELVSFLMFYKLWVGAVILTIILILLIIKFWENVKFWWLCFWTSFPIFGYISSLYKSTSKDKDGWFKSEKTICSKFYSFYRNLSGKDPEFYRNCALYLEKVQETDRKELPAIMWIIIFLLVVAEALGFAYVLAGYTIPGASESLQQKGALAIAFVISIILVGFTHFTGGEIYRNTMYKKIREWWANEDDAQKSRLKPDNEEITLENNRIDDGRPKYVKVLNRVNANANVESRLVISGITIALIVFIAIGATYVRGQVLEKQLIQEVTNVTTNSYESALPEVAQTLSEADAQVLKEEQNADRKGGWATFIVLAVLFVFIQILGILFGYKWGFVGKESKKAYRYIKNFSNADEFEDYYERVRDYIISKANEKLSDLQAKMANRISKTSISPEEKDLAYSASSRTFERYIELQMASKSEMKKKNFDKNIIVKEQSFVNDEEIYQEVKQEPQEVTHSKDLTKRREILEIKKELKELQKTGANEERIIELEEKLLELEE